MAGQQMTLLDEANARRLQVGAPAAPARAQRSLTPAQMAKWQKDAACAQAAVAEMNRAFQRAALRGLMFCEAVQLWREANCV